MLLGVDTDVEKSMESNSEEAGGNRSRTSVESAIVSSSLSVNLSKNLYVDGEKFELSSQVRYAQIDGQTKRQTHIHTHRQIDRQTDGLTDGLTD